MTPHDIGNLFLRDYLIAMYVATLGVVQIGASYGGLRGMLFLPSPRAARWFGAVLMVVAFAYFFTVPLWAAGPWGPEATDAAAGGVSPGVIGRDGLTVVWDTAGWSGLGGAHNLNDVDGGLSGGSQGIWFPLAAGLALISTFLISSVVNRGLREIDYSRNIFWGVELLKNASWAAAVRPSLAAARADWRQIVRGEFDGDHEWGGIRMIVNRWRSR
ncbi:MAG: hypothetical protein IH868_11675 [Chloroflexi bacterium]|nr:hypothetical protein [Chloroflexota bacterium]MCH8224058.1 hypothetical protein [Chloroflexota bacterium]